MKLANCVKLSLLLLSFACTQHSFAVEKDPSKQEKREAKKLKEGYWQNVI